MQVYYKLGLDIDPMHNGINEYLGELYFNTTGRIELAKERLNILKIVIVKNIKSLKKSLKEQKNPSINKTPCLNYLLY